VERRRRLMLDKKEGVVRRITSSRMLGAVKVAE